MYRILHIFMLLELAFDVKITEYAVLGRELAMGSEDAAVEGEGWQEG